MNFFPQKIDLQNPVTCLSFPTVLFLKSTSFKVPYAIMHFASFDLYDLATCLFHSIYTSRWSRDGSFKRGQGLKGTNFIQNIHWQVCVLSLHLDAKPCLFQAQLAHIHFHNNLHFIKSEVVFLANFFPRKKAHADSLSSIPVIIGYYKFISIPIVLSSFLWTFFLFCFMHNLYGHNFFFCCFCGVFFILKQAIDTFVPLH